MNRLGAQINVQEWDFGDALLKMRLASAIDDAVTRYPIFRTLQFAARRKLDELFDSLSLDLGWRAHRLETSSVILEAEGLFAVARGFRKNDYCSSHINLWAESRTRAESACAAILALVGSTRILDPMFTIDWHFLTGRGELENASIEELANDRLYDSAYPYLPGGVGVFIDRYLDAEETVLVLQGPPGTGKTRLIRGILGALSRRKGGHASAVYTGDRKTMEGDQIFVKFITGWHDAFVVEDADHLLRPRAEGNENLHRFLAIADGVVRSQGRKIIFSTNLPNVGDLDDALVRAGRCFDHVMTRELAYGEAVQLMDDLSRTRNTQPSIVATATAALSKDARSHSLAEIYQSVNRAR
jgi:energy-coupling factor transporter ATP-binding protein EcfA2